MNYVLLTGDSFGLAPSENFLSSPIKLFVAYAPGPGTVESIGTDVLPLSENPCFVLIEETGSYAPGPGVFSTDLALNLPFNVGPFFSRVEPMLYEPGPGTSFGTIQKSVSFSSNTVRAFIHIPDVVGRGLPLLSGFTAV